MLVSRLVTGSEGEGVPHSGGNAAGGFDGNIISSLTAKSHTECQ